MAKSSKEPIDLRNMYLLMMQEIKLRQAIVDASIKGQTKLPPVAAHELCYLQFRYICELIALSCLAAHGDIEATQRPDIQKTYKPSVILAEMAKLHPEFYPVPTEPILDEKTGLATGTKPLEEEYLTKSDLLKLWADSGDILHRGCFRDMAFSTPPDVEKVNTWNAKIIRLLQHHQIKLSFQGYELWVRMRDSETGHPVAVLMTPSNST